MTKEITKAFILGEIQDIFKLREFEHANFLFSETVIPTFAIDPLLINPETKIQDISVTGTGGLGFFNVPPTERWTLYMYDVVFMGAGAFTIAGVYISRKNKETADATIYLDLTPAQTASYHVQLPVPIRLDPNDMIRINVDGYTSTQDLRLILDCTVEEIR